MLNCTSHIVDDIAPTKIVDGANLGEYEVLIQVQFSAIIGGSDVSLTNGLLINPTSNGNGDLQGILKLRLHSEDLYAISNTTGSIVITTLVYSV